MKCSNCPYIEKVQHKFGTTIHCNLEPTHMDITLHYLQDDYNSLCPFICKTTRFPGIDYSKYEI